MMAFSGVDSVIVVAFSAAYGIFKSWAVMAAFPVKWDIIKAVMGELFEGMTSTER